MMTETANLGMDGPARLAAQACQDLLKPCSDAKGMTSA